MEFQILLSSGQLQFTIEVGGTISGHCTPPISGFTIAVKNPLGDNTLFVQLHTFIENTRCKFTKLPKVGMSFFEGLENNRSAFVFEWI